MDEPDAQAIAERVRVELLAQDRATCTLGAQVLSIAPGRARLSMHVREDMLNGHQTCHGGFIAALADSAFAFACNASNELTVAAGFSIDFLAPSRLGDVLTASCVERSRGARIGLYDVEVVNQRGEPIATFRGRSYTLKGRPAVPDPACRTRRE
jgi:acyl-CoA thioesterase